jgi:ABC-type multidrug transport system permease subunit
MVPCVCVCVVGLLFLAMMFLAFGGMAEVPIAAQARSVVLKQYAARMYGIPAFVLSTAIAYIPLAIVDTFVFGSIVYW